ncbi:radical SAM protein [Moorella sp. Hama-1]|uniref:radical SAM protein n=1 Tax=Moorella sp. Hama-1 TaxID=2138101 RepID=UPI000D653FD1|nr:radical SAM protein [Moorella sp. Hama-1]MDN5362214.1 lipoyl synthase [Moorella sp. (in: firmicutes)]BCV20264.1 radical SAM family protein [Moorella sp. Hama-1]
MPAELRRQLATIHRLPLKELLPAAWQLRLKNFPPVLGLATPGSKHYDSGDHRNDRRLFVTISLTGAGCRLQCEHCRGELLKSMYPAGAPAELLDLGRQLRDGGCHGVLVSGGADAGGRVPLQPYLKSLAGLKNLGLKVIVHTGLADPVTARGLKNAGVDQVLLDIIGDRETARRVYHLEKGPADYGAALENLLAAGLKVVPHIVAGLNFGRIAGEVEALYQVLSRDCRDLVLVVLTPLPGTPMAGVTPPAPAAVARLLATARLAGSRLNLLLGCSRPAGRHRLRTEFYALRAGVNGIAYPHEGTVARARHLGLQTFFSDLCCSLL